MSATRDHTQRAASVGQREVTRRRPCTFVRQSAGMVTIEGDLVPGGQLIELVERLRQEAGRAVLPAKLNPGVDPVQQQVIMGIDEAGGADRRPAEVKLTRAESEII